MIKRLIFLGLLSIAVEADAINDKILNLVGQESYDLHANLINEILKDETPFILNKNINYNNLLVALKKEELINLIVNEQTEITVSFSIKDNHKKGFKILKEVLANLGYSYYFTDFIKNTNGTLVWKIRFKADSVLDPLALQTELAKFSANLTDINKIDQTKWEYSIDAKNGILNDIIRVIPNQKTPLQIPLQPYTLLLKDATELIIASNKLNSWVPKISFYDNELNALGTIEMDRVYDGIKVSVPRNSKYAKIGDRYSLFNIKRGLVITVSTIFRNN